LAKRKIVKACCGLGVWKSSGLGEHSVCRRYGSVSQANPSDNLSGST
jgi:hypothetical protein